MTGLQFIRVRIFAALFVCVLAIAPLSSNAQCAMCTLNAENSTKEGNTQGNGLNSGILFLLSMPFMIAGGIGVLWYTKFRRPGQDRVSAALKQVNE